MMDKVILYLSKLNLENEDQEIIDSIFLKSYSYNSKHSLSGMILYSHYYFLQLIQGPQDEVDVLYSRIKKDHRHVIELEITREDFIEQVFQDWTYGRCVEGGDFNKKIEYIISQLHTLENQDHIDVNEIAEIFRVYRYKKF